MSMKRIILMIMMMMMTRITVFNEGDAGDLYIMEPMLLFCCRGTEAMGFRVVTVIGCRMRQSANMHTTREILFAAISQKPCRVQTSIITQPLPTHQPIPPFRFAHEQRLTVQFASWYLIRISPSGGLTGGAHTSKRRPILRIFVVWMWGIGRQGFRPKK